jgi:hypothetical protein
MLGKRSVRGALFDAEHVYLDLAGRDSFYCFLASRRGQLVSEDECGAPYMLDNGWPGVPRSLLAVALLQTHDRVSDEEVTERVAFDLRWKDTLGIGLEDRPFVKGRLQLFPAQLVVHEQLEVALAGAARQEVRGTARRSRRSTRPNRLDRYSRRSGSVG